MTAPVLFSGETGLTHLMADRVSYYVQTADLGAYNDLMICLRAQRKSSFFKKMLPLYAFVQKEVAQRRGLGLCLSALHVFPDWRGLTARFDVGRERLFAVMTVEHKTLLGESPSPKCFRFSYGEEGEATIPAQSPFHAQRRVLEFLNCA